VEYAVIDFRRTARNQKPKDEMWLAEVVSDAMTTLGPKVSEMHIVMKIIDSQFQTTQMIAIPLLIIYVLLNLTPLVAQMLATDESSFLILTCIFTFTNFLPFGFIELIYGINAKNDYFEDPWNLLDVANVIFPLVYSFISFIYSSELVEMNVLYTDEASPEHFD
jgi:hypothetical protein